MNGLTIGPSGGNFLAMDGALRDTAGISLQGRVSQTIKGLHVGVPTTVEFEWAAAQQAGFTGANTEQLQVSLGSQSFKTGVINNTSEGFQPWRPDEFTFTPTSTSEVLSFLAIGTPEVGVGSAGPPFVLLDGGVHLEAVPEPATWSLLGIGLAAIAGAAYRRPKSLCLPG